jgi:hypothetical protein
LAILIRCVSALSRVNSLPLVLTKASACPLWSQTMKQGAVSKAAASGVALSEVVLNYGVLAPLCDPILDRALIYRAAHQVAALHEAIEGYADFQFANVAPEATGTS